MNREILLADDDGALRQLLAEALVRAGYRVTEVATGDGMIEVIAKRSVRQRGFDLIISDVRMPGFTGLEVIEAMREPWADEALHLRTTPVILMSAFVGEEIDEEARRLGAVAISKPFDVDDLLALVAQTSR